MNPEIKTQWVAALRSGEYEQGRGVLHHVPTNTFCCLGVLCDLAAKAGVVEADHGPDLTVYDGHTAVLPESVYRWAGLDMDHPSVKLVDGLDGLAAHNDNGVLFPELADAIEGQL